MNGNSWAIRLEMRRKLVPISKRRDGEERRWMEMRHASSSSMEERPRLGLSAVMKLLGSH